MKKIIVTTSWDDGHRLDLKLASLLDKYNLKGTFYVPKKYLSESLSVNEVKNLALRHEIGAHTLNHVNLVEASLEEAKNEIFDSKKYLEDLIGKPIKMFCYPKGTYNQKVKELVAKAGFLGARTIQPLIFTQPKDFFELGVSLQVYPFPLRKKDANHFHLSIYLFQPLARNFKVIKRLSLPFNSWFNWLNLAKNLVDFTWKKGEVFHLWGHSWEIERYGMWGQLEELFKYISSQTEVAALTNSEVLKSYEDFTSK